ncbi:MAG: peptidylprolyl isomerase [Balneolaceae bacterium]
MKYRILTLVSLASLLAILSCQPGLYSELEEMQAPARFETTKGDFEIVSLRDWSPAGVDRLYQLIQSEFYTDIGIFRVVPGYVAQFGLHDDNSINNAWDERPLPDEPVLKANTKGTIGFARAGAETRTTQLFINLENNSPRLDTLTVGGVSGYPVVAEIVSGMDVVESFYDEYANEPSMQQDSIRAGGNAFLQQNYPNIDYIKRAYLIGNEE